MGNAPINSSTSQTQVANTVNGVIRDLQSLQTVQVFKDEEGTRTAILDKDGLRTTAPGSGIDVFSATNDQLTFNSAFNTFKIVGTGTHTITKAANSQSQTDTIDISSLNLTGVPLMVASVLDGGFYYSLPFQLADTSGTTNGGRTNLIVRVAASDSTSASVQVVTPNYTGNTLYTSALEYTIKYYILQETAN